MMNESIESYCGGNEYSVMLLWMRVFSYMVRCMRCCDIHQHSIIKPLLRGYHTKVTNFISVSQIIRKLRLPRNVPWCKKTMTHAIFGENMHNIYCSFYVN